MSVFELHRIGDLTTVGSGSGFPTKHQGVKDADIPFYKVSDMNLNGNEVWMHTHNNSITRAGQASLKAKTHPKDTIIFPKIGAAIATNKKRILTRESCFDNNVIGIHPSKYFETSYLYHLIQTKNLSEFANKGNPPSIRKPTIEEWKIPLPPLDEQKRIAGILDAADELRAKRRQTLVELDTLIQSTFLDLFGDPVTNPKGWETSTLKATGCHIQIGPFGSLLHKEDYVSNGIPLVNPKHIKNGNILPGLDETISQEKANDLANYMLQSGDVILGRRGEMGRCAIVDLQHCQLLCGTGSLFIRPDTTIFTSFYLMMLLSNSSMKAYLEKIAWGVTMANLNKTKIQSLQVALPPLDLQRKFADIVEKIEAQKSRCQAQLDELDTLFVSLQSRAFKGEL